MARFGKFLCPFLSSLGAVLLSFTAKVLTFFPALGGTYHLEGKYFLELRLTSIPLGLCSFYALRICVQIALTFDRICPYNAVKVAFIGLGTHLWAYGRGTKARGKESYRI